MSRPINRMRPVHPGEILREEFLAPLGMSVNALALALCVPATRIHEIVKERRSISADTAERLARYFGGDAESWMNLQASYDLKTLPTREEIRRRVEPRSAREGGKTGVWLPGHPPSPSPPPATLAPTREENQ